jgi:hypothetical protein
LTCGTNRNPRSERFSGARQSRGARRCSRTSATCLQNGYSTEVTIQIRIKEARKWRIHNSIRAAEKPSEEPGSESPQSSQTLLCVAMAGRTVTDAFAGSLTRAIRRDGSRTKLHAAPARPTAAASVCCIFTEGDEASPGCPLCQLLETCTSDWNARLFILRRGHCVTCLSQPALSDRHFLMWHKRGLGYESSYLKPSYALPTFHGFGL